MSYNRDLREFFKVTYMVTSTRGIIYDQPMLLAAFRRSTEYRLLWTEAQRKTRLAKARELLNSHLWMRRYTGQVPARVLDALLWEVMGA